MTTMDEVTTEFLALIKGIWDKFPELKEKDLYMTGESYAGHFIPAFSYALEQEGTFRLKASLLGNPFVAGMT